MATLASDIVARVENRLLSGIREPRNKLAAAITDTTGATVTFAYPLAAVAAGAAFYVDLEGFYTWNVDTSAKTATAERGQFGTTAATHLINSIAYVNPRFPKPQILQAVNEELDDLSSPANGLFRLRTVDLTFSVSKVAYDLTSVTNVEGIYEVEARYPWLSGNWGPVERWHVERNSNTTDFPSGFALHIGEGGFPGQTVRVKYKDRFASLATLADDVQTVSFLPSTANDILVLGARMRLMEPRESKRTFTESQGDTRRAEEVPSGSVSATVRQIAALRAQRIAAEAARLHRQYPTVKQGR